MEITPDTETLNTPRRTAFCEVENISNPHSRRVFLTFYAKCCSSMGFFSSSSFGLSSRRDLKKDKTLLKKLSPRGWFRFRSVLKGDFNFEICFSLGFFSFLLEKNWLLHEVAFDFNLSYRDFVFFTIDKWLSSPLGDAHEQWVLNLRLSDLFTS